MNTLSTKQAQQLLRKRYQEAQNEYRIYEKLTVILGEFDGEKIGRRMKTAIENGFKDEGYNVTFYSESGYERLAIRDSKDTFQLHINTSHQEKFNFEKWYENNNRNDLLALMIKLKPYIENEDLLNEYLEKIALVSQAVQNLSEAIRECSDVWYSLSEGLQEMQGDMKRCTP